MDSVVTSNPTVELDVTYISDIRNFAFSHVFKNYIIFPEFE